MSDKVSIVIVSHSPDVAKGTADMVRRASARRAPVRGRPAGSLCCCPGRVVARVLAKDFADGAVHAHAGAGFIERIAP